MSHDPHAGDGSAPEPSPSTTVQLLRTSFGRFFVANLTGNIAGWLSDIAAAILIYQVTGSALWVSAVAVVSFGTSITAAPIGGALADRFDRRRVATVAFAIMGSVALLVATLSFFFHIALLVLVLTAVGGAARGIYTPIGQALAADMVDRRDLAASSSLTAMGFSLGRAIGPAVGAVLITNFGGPVTFLTAAAMAGLFVALMSGMPGVAGPTHSLRRAKHDSTWSFIRARPRIVVLLITSAIIGMMTDPVITLGPAITAGWHAPAWVAGLLVSAFGLGAVLTGPFGAQLQRRVRAGRLSIVALVVVGTCLALVGQVRNPVVGIIALGVAGAGFLAANTDVVCLLQEQLDPGIRGRVWAVWSIGFLGSRPIAAVAEGFVADRLGVGVALAGMACVAVLGAGLMRVYRLVPTEPLLAVG